MTMLVRIIPSIKVARWAMEMCDKSSPSRKRKSLSGIIMISKKLLPRILPMAMSTANVSAVIETMSSGREVARARKVVPTKLSLHPIILTTSSPIKANHIPRITILIKQRQNLAITDFKEIRAYKGDPLGSSEWEI